MLNRDPCVPCAWLSEPGGSRAGGRGGGAVGRIPRAQRGGGHGLDPVQGGAELAPARAAHSGHVRHPRTQPGSHAHRAARGPGCAPNMRC